jgi:O-acetylserine/cysteine efflux transporter
VNPRDVALAVLVAALWGFNFVVIAVGVASIPPLLLSALRFTFAAFPMVLFVGWPKVAWRWVFAIGVALGVIKFSLLFVGMDVGMPAGLASVVMQSQIFFTALLSATLLGERSGPAHLAGMAISFGGMDLIAADLGVDGSLRGFLLVVAAAATWGLVNVFMRLATATDVLNLMVWVSVVPPVPLFLISWLLEGGEGTVAAISSLGWIGAGAVLYLAFVATIVGFGAWGYLLQKYPATVVAPFSLLVPVFGMASSALLLGEKLGTLRLVGAALVICGLALGLYRRRKVVGGPVTEPYGDPSSS